MCQEAKVERFTAKTVDQFLDALASSEPVPGGGSGAALAGALAAGLLSMVCNLTIGKKGKLFHNLFIYFPQ